MVWINTYQTMSNKHLPQCSLIISTYNWPEALKSCVERIFAQTHLPQEILIADDGSGSRTRETIEQLSRVSPVPLHHIWHADDGFRLSEIRNKAIAQAKYPYIIQIDGDICAESHFIEDHLKMSKPGTFLCGSRVLLSEKLSKRIVHDPNYTWNRLQLPLGYLLNSLRIPILGRFLAARYKRNQLTALRGCNMSFWRADLIKVNGYNNAITGWGSEDAELVIRLHNLGCIKHFLKFMGIAYHIYHPENDKSRLSRNQEVQERALAEKITYITNGIYPERNQKTHE